MTASVTVDSRASDVWLPKGNLLFSDQWWLEMKRKGLWIPVGSFQAFSTFHTSSVVWGRDFNHQAVVVGYCCFCFGIIYHQPAIISIDHDQVAILAIHQASTFTIIPPSSTIHWPFTAMNESHVTFLLMSIISHSTAVQQPFNSHSLAINSHYQNHQPTSCSRLYPSYGCLLRLIHQPFRPPPTNHQSAAAWGVRESCSSENGELGDSGVGANPWRWDLVANWGAGLGLSRLVLGETPISNKNHA